MSAFKQSDTFKRWQNKSLIALRLQRLLGGNAGDVAPVGAGISELRVHHGPGYRVYFQRRGDLIILLLCGGDKSTQEKDIGMAKQIAAEWKDDNG
ncbi:putative addiction module killer protein [Phyllobacterium sp. 1468]|uniref:type II toxin-antitoxin system RelE/ParE family toxin n=1 Tax=Phyllobacterium sp. 1468 TaxID=2817759 RepID=UPI00285F4FD6|nr:type II toxin-antitoxin system RelE/ParE family toxin [Phyllobacterium sp. 1468]MDR6632708.1 putative addiction module killer protein [Phyllobacterium sp. 1468]